MVLREYAIGNGPVQAPLQMPMQKIKQILTYALVSSLLLCYGSVIVEAAYFYLSFSDLLCRTLFHYHSSCSLVSPRKFILNKVFHQLPIEQNLACKRWGDMSCQSKVDQEQSHQFSLLCFLGDLLEVFVPFVLCTLASFSLGTFSMADKLFFLFSFGIIFGAKIQWCIVLHTPLYSLFT